jgi:diadenosine tetraphosphate (Ap4A) HIT family hydrolase
VDPSGGDAVLDPLATRRGCGLLDRLIVLQFGSVDRLLDMWSHAVLRYAPTAVATPTATACPFCTLPIARTLRANDLAVVIRDAFPVSRGHTLVLPRRHVGSFFDLQPAERDALFDLLDLARQALDESLQPAGYNIGINDGPAAGQTMPHLHVHLIPRFAGD